MIVVITYLNGKRKYHKYHKINDKTYRGDLLANRRAPRNRRPAAPVSFCLDIMIPVIYNTVNLIIKGEYNYGTRNVGKRDRQLYPQS